MNILLVCQGFFVLLFIIIFIIQSTKIIKLSAKSKNNVHFYVARDEYNEHLYLYLSKPCRDTDRFHACDKGSIVEIEDFLYNFGLNPKDFENLTFEDEPVEVFLNLND